MQTHALTTPFGRRPLSLALLQGQIETAATAVDRPVDKWTIFRDLSQAREKLGLQDRSLAVLHALLSFYPHPELCVTKGLVVFPSNAQLSLRAHGIAGTTLRRHLAALVEAGLIHRRDSPNGKRYARRRASGQIGEAFGFDLRPLLARSHEIAELAQAVSTERRALSEAREALTICRRDIRKLLAAAIEAGLCADGFAEDGSTGWDDLSQRFEALLLPLPRRSSIDHVSAVLRGLQQLRGEIVNLLTTQLNCGDLVVNDRQDGRHIQNPDTESHLDPETPGDVIDQADAKDEVGLSRIIRPGGVRAAGKGDLPLPLVLKACPDIRDYGPGGEIRDWGDLARAAVVVRSMFGIQADVYEDACATMGIRQAATAMACILMRIGRIKAPGAYLRDLTKRARRDGFSPAPMVMALLRAREETVEPQAEVSIAADLRGEISADAGPPPADRGWPASVLRPRPALRCYRS